MAAEFQSRPGMKVTVPTPVQVGGLQGIVMDLQRDEAWTGDCFRGWLLVGVPPSGLAHGLNDVVVMRLYLLKRGDTRSRLRSTTVPTAAIWMLIPASSISSSSAPDGDATFPSG
jgi:hypothetical protein